MKNKRTSFYRIILLMFCQCFLCLSSVYAEEKTDYSKLISHCDEVKEILKNIQREDSRVRVYLGSYYETILTKYVTKLNLRLVENNLSQAGLIEGQTNIAQTRASFTEDFISYQKKLEDLTMIDCKSEPSRFYTELGKVREERANVAKDVVKLKEYIAKHRQEVSGLKKKIEKNSSSNSSEELDNNVGGEI